MRRHSSHSTDHVRAGGETLRPETRTLINYIWSKEELPDSGRSQWRTQEFFSWGVQRIQLRTEDRDDGDLEAVAP